MVKRRLDNAHQRRAKRETNNHGYPKGESHLHDGPPQVFEMLKKRFRRFGFRRITKFKNVSESHRTGSSARSERHKTARGERGADGKCVSVANLVVRNHATDFSNSKLAAIENPFAF